LLGLIAFFFACFGAGTPHFDDFAKQAFKGKKEEIAPRNFLAQIPLKMPGHPRGGALAVVGHVDRVWSYSFDWPGAGARTDVIESTLRRLLDEYPLGSAVENFNERYAELSTLLSDELADIDFGKKADPYELSVMWTANNDARGYTVIGDPAVRLPVVKQGEESGERPVIEVKPASDGQPATVVGLEAAAKIGVAGEHRITVTTFEESGPDGWEVAAETTLTISSGKEVSESQTTVAEDEEVQAAHRALVQEARAACQAYIDTLAPDDD
jgi:hypothetical protein